VNEAARPLEGLLVLDLTRVLAGPYATQMLGDLGADVWKVERPGEGDETRAWGPPWVGELSAYFVSINRNKRSAALDFGDATHREAIRRAALAADVVVENYLPGSLARFGLDAASLRRVKSSLVVCSITGYGQDGPYAMLPGYDAVLQGFTGLQAVTGFPDGPGVKVGVALIDVLAGVHAAAAILAALVGVGRGRGGAHVDLSLFEVGLHSMVNVTQSALSSGQPARRHGNAHPNIVPYQTFEAMDGPFVVAAGNDLHWRKLCDALGDVPPRASEWAQNPQRVLRRTDVIEWLASRFASAPREAWLARLRAAGVPCGPVRNVQEAVADPAFAARGMVADTELSGGGRTPLMSLPWRIEAERPPLRLPPPRLGEHTQEFLARFGA
jgi:crotonobetainyl-CoA:carnitine CoA-transferase CaiB-like acyl-CoA transferase